MLQAGQRVDERKVSFFYVVLDAQTLQEGVVERDLAIFFQIEVQVVEDVVAVVVANRVHPLEVVVRLTPLVATVEEVSRAGVRNDQLLQFDPIDEALPPLRDLGWKGQLRNGKKWLVFGSPD